MEDLKLTDEERQLIITRRELFEKRQKRQNTASQTPSNQKADPKGKQDVILGQNRPKGWDSHCHPCQIHAGRMTEVHPLFWFESEIFRKISNMQHKEQHKKIAKILNIPVQNIFRDRQYHALAHLEALWQQQLLPVKYKRKYEAYMEEHGIGQDFVHPEHKKQKPDYKHPMPVIKRTWDAEKYEDVDEEFVVGKKYRYSYDDEIGYKFED